MNSIRRWWRDMCVNVSQWKVEHEQRNTAMISDAEIFRRSLDDPDTFAELFDRYSAMIYRYSSRRLGPDLAEDMVGETFLVAFQRRGRYDLSYDDARPWLFGIASKLIARHHRTEAARYRALGRRADDRPVEGPLDDLVVARVTASNEGRRLTSALAQLSKRDRDVLLLVAWGDLQYDEVVRALGIPIGTVRSRLHRARQTLRDALGDTNPLGPTAKEDPAWMK